MPCALIALISCVGPACAGGFESRCGPLADDRTLELGERSEDVEDQPIAGGRGVDRLGERAQADLAPLELLDGLDQLPDRAGEPVELPDDQRVPSRS